MDGLHRPTVIWVSHIGLGRQSNGTLAMRQRQVPNDATNEFGRRRDSKEESQKVRLSEGSRAHSKYRKVRFPTVPPQRTFIVV